MAAGPLGVLILDADFRVRFAEGQLPEVFGWFPSALLGRALSDLLDGQTACAIAERLRSNPEAGLHVSLPLAGAGQGFEALAIFHPLAGPSAETGWLLALCPPGMEKPAPELDRSAPVSHPLAQGLSEYATFILKALPDPVALLDRGCRLLAANPPFLALIGATPPRCFGQPLVALGLDPALISLIYRHLSRCLDEGETALGEFSRVSPEGHRHDYQVRLAPYGGDEGPASGLTLVIQEVSLLRQAEQRLSQAEAVYATTAEGLLITDAQGIAITVNPAFTRITGYAESEILGQRPYLLNAQWHTRAFFIRLWRHLRKRGSWQGEVWSRRKDGEIYRQRLSIRRVLDRQGRVSSFVVVLAERTSASPGLRSFESLIHYDALTRLPNRVLFELRLEHALAQQSRHGSALAVLIIDLDHFSHINTSLGYRIGDELLRVTALRLREAIHPSNTLARLHADRFALLLEGLGAPEETTQVANQLRALMSEPIWVRGHELHVSLSIGIALLADPGEDAPELMLKAELALRQAKRQGRNGIYLMLNPAAAVDPKQRRWIARLHGYRWPLSAQRSRSAIARAAT
ncbi:sensor domain-containing diguanylate cyclase [Caldichromatium japonicum]|uniref:Sensor domain-containing diguanylate cyclase n=1 Tax=Caldichromatium japonicum TaxID=2699430 RepID=A0A6G7VDI6_9GAMM|nr:sensor domain-containing diguanylate cyclase [Caldichromatium japonicum]QIK37970.1 sensor domain-containing diguanylate cyclase [Caldichromatium japonicum]